MQRMLTMTRGGAAALVVVGVSAIGPAGPLAGQNLERPAPETYHWVLPVSHPGIEVATLHSNDCYVIQDAKGVAYFGEPGAGLLELQRQLIIPVSHLIETRDGHPECALGSCTRVEELAAAIERELAASGEARLTRRVDHRPTPRDNWFGGAYTDVGSDDRETYNGAREQRTLFQHRPTAARSNCYEAKVPRVLSVHVRDRQRHQQRTGVYRGFLYVEHHHPILSGDTIAALRTDLRRGQL